MFKDARHAPFFNAALASNFLFILGRDTLLMLIKASANSTAYTDLFLVLAACRTLQLGLESYRIVFHLCNIDLTEAEKL